MAPKLQGWASRAHGQDVGSSPMGSAGVLGLWLVGAVLGPDPFLAAASCVHVLV